MSARLPAGASIMPAGRGCACSLNGGWSPMEFHIDVTGLSPDMVAIEAAIHAVDPAALVDIDTARRTARVSAWLDAAQLLALVNHAGCPVAQDRVTRIPSICCGGWSGLPG